MIRRSAILFFLFGFSDRKISRTKYCTRHRICAVCVTLLIDRLSATVQVHWIPDACPGIRTPRGERELPLRTRWVSDKSLPSPAMFEIVGGGRWYNHPACRKFRPLSLSNPKPISISPIASGAFRWLRRCRMHETIGDAPECLPKQYKTNFASNFPRSCSSRCASRTTGHRRETSRNGSADLLPQPLLRESARNH